MMGLWSDIVRRMMRNKKICLILIQTHVSEKNKVPYLITFRWHGGAGNY